VLRRDKVPGRGQGPARHEWRDVDEAALVAARDADRLLASAKAHGADRWADFFGSLPDRLRDDDLRDLQSTARRARAAFGPKDSVRDSLPPDVTEPLLASIDRLLKALARREAAGEL